MFLPFRTSASPWLFFSIHGIGNPIGAVTPSVFCGSIRFFFWTAIFGSDNILLTISYSVYQERDVFTYQPNIFGQDPLQPTYLNSHLYKKKKVMFIQKHNQLPSPPLIERKEIADKWSCTSEWAVTKMRQFCAGQVYLWIECVKRRLGPSSDMIAVLMLAQQQYYCNEGLHGIAILVRLKNNPSQFRVSFHQNATSKSDDSLSADFTQSEQLRKKEVFAIMKMVKPEGEDRNQLYAIDRKRTLHQKEIERGRGMARLESIPGIPFSPKWYDVMDRITGKSHEFSRTGFLMEFLHGLPAIDVIQTIIRSEYLAMEMVWEKIMRRCETVLAMPYSNWAVEYTINAIEKIEGELLFRVRYRLSLLDIIFYLAELLALKGVSHCDFHLGNIIILSKIQRQAQSVVEAVESGREVFSPTKLHFSLDITAELDEPFWKKELEEQGIPTYGLEIKDIRVIDTSHALNISAVVENVGGNKNDVSFPCRVDRGRNDDIIEMLKTTDLILLSQTKRGVPRNEAPSLAKRWKAIGESYRRLLPHLFVAIESDNEIIKALRRVEDFIEEYDNELVSLHRDILLENSLRACDGLDKQINEIDLRLLRDFISQDSKERARALNRLGNDCSIATAEKAIAGARKLIAIYAHRMEAKIRTFVGRPISVSLAPPTSLR